MSDWKLHESTLLQEKYYSTVHKSGLPIYVFPKQMSTTYAMLAVRYGSVDDTDGARRFPDGIAHFLEHKLFSNEDGSDSFERFAAYGADANAYTSHSRTVYLFSCTNRFTDSLTELLTFTTHPYFTKQTVDKEKGIIAEEIRMCRDNPYECCYYNMLAGLYEKHPVKKEICGTERSIAQITAKTLYDTYRTYYQLSNMALIVCGDLTVEQVLAVADAHLPRDAASLQVPRHYPNEPARAHRARVAQKGQVATPIFCIGVKECELPVDPVERLRRDAGLTVLAEMLFSESSELYQYLFDNRFISPEFSADYALTRGFGFMQICGEADDPDAVLREILAYLEAKRGLSREEFERAKCVEFAEYIKSFDSTEEIANTLLAFVFDNAELFSYADIVQGLDYDYVLGLFEQFFQKDRFTLSVINPQE